MNKKNILMYGSLLHDIGKLYIEVVIIHFQEVRIQN